LAACAPATAQLTTEPAGPTPTTHPFFEPGTPIVAFPTVDQLPFTPAPTLTFTPPISETVIPLSALLLTNTIFDEALSPNWAMEASPDLTFTLDDPMAIHSENTALTLIGQAGDSLLFRLRANSSERYEREKVFAVSFWVYGGENGIETDDLLVQAFASDDVFYWVRNDTSAITDLNTFSGTLLYGLGLNRDIPPNTWGKIEVLLEALAYDPNFDDSPVEIPEYFYFTGFSILYAEGFEGTIVVDEVSVLSWVEE